MPSNTCSLDELDSKSEWARGLRVVKDFLQEVGDDQYETVLPWMDCQAGWRVGDLEVCVLWIYGTPVVEMRNDARRDGRGVKRVPLVETVIQQRGTPARRHRWHRLLGDKWRTFVMGYARSMSQPPDPVAQHPVDKDGLWHGLRAITA